ncbi:MAG: hypothetical protein RLZZ458_929, partial [Planctomycetota bacterium]
MNSSRAGINSPGAPVVWPIFPGGSGSREYAVRRQHLNDSADTIEVQNLLRLKRRAAAGNPQPLSAVMIGAKWPA